MAKWENSMLSMLIVVLSFSFVALGTQVTNNANFQAFYFIQQWLGSYCSQKGEQCCYPATGKPTPDFTVYGLWPQNSDNTFPTNCGGASFDVDPLKPLQEDLQKAWPTFTCPIRGRKFWLHEWNKRGTCSKSVLDEVPYLQTAINLKTKINLLQILSKSGINPDNRSYSLSAIKQAISSAFGFEPWLACNSNAQGVKQIWQVILCVDGTGKNLIKCPVFPDGNPCPSTVLFPSS